MGFQEIPITEIVRPITKKAFKMSIKDDVYEVLTDLLNIAIEGRPGPVWLDVPLDIQNFPYSSDKRDRNSKAIQFTNSVDAISESSKLTTSINEVIADLKKSNKPVMLLGNGVRLSGCVDAAIKFANDLKIPVLLTWKMMDILDELDPLNAGRPGAIPQPWSNKIQEEADLILSIGARIDTGQSAYNLKTFGKRALKIVVDIDSNELAKFPSGANYKLINQNANTFIQELSEKCQLIELPEKWNTWRKQVAELKNHYSFEFYNRKSPDSGINLYNFIRVLSNLLDDDAILIPGSSGACSEIVMQAFKVKKGQRILNSEGLGSMGFGIPAAFGVHLASDGHNIICIDGDGGFQMNVQELATVNLNAKNMTFFVLNNNGYGSIKTTQDKYFSGRRIGTDPTSGLALINLSLIAESFGLNYWKIETEKDMESIIHEVLASNSNSIVEIIVDEYQSTSPRVVSTRNDKGEFMPVDMSIFQY
jgi:acetolactate synthase-1/2/3 large subunit